MSEKNRKKISEEEKKEWLQIEGLNIVCGEQILGVYGVSAYLEAHVWCEMRDVLYSEEQEQYIFLCHLTAYDKTVYVKMDAVRYENEYSTNVIVDLLGNDRIVGDCPALAADIRKAVESIKLYGLEDLE